MCWGGYRYRCVGEDTDTGVLGEDADTGVLGRIPIPVRIPIPLRCPTSED